MGKVVILNDDEISKRKILPYRIKPKDELEEKMELKEYYFVKCFTAKKYRDDFNNGVDMCLPDKTDDGEFSWSVL